MADIEDSCLYIAGNIKQSGLSKKERRRYFKLDNVVQTGVMGQRALGGLLKAVNGVVHLCWFDNCPNSVIEAICSKKHVVTNNVGGTHEIIERCGGFVCNIDKAYNYKPCDLYNPPSINRQIIADNIQKCISTTMKVDNDSVNIKNIAKEYLSFFRSIL